MKITFEETTFEFKMVWSRQDNRYEIHLFKNDVFDQLVPISGDTLPSADIVFGMYIQLLKHRVKFDSVKIHFKDK